MLQFAIATLVILRCAYLFSLLIRSSGPVLGLPLHLAQDDLFYYIRPAQNFAAHGRPTFFENVLTNGFHPLYFLLLAASSVWIKSLGGLFRLLWVLDTASAACLFLLARRLFAKVASPLLANAIAILLTAVSVTQICDQMEVTLALPLGFAFLLAAFVPPEALKPRRAALLGLLSALLFLARLDAVLLPLVYVVAMLLVRGFRRELTPKTVLCFLAAFLPLPALYVGINRAVFSTWLPISGMAKELRSSHRPTVLLPASFSGISEVLVFAAIGAAVLAWSLRRHWEPAEKVFLAATLLTPFLFYGVEMVLSDWQMWNWYFYMLRFSAVGCAMLFALWVQRGLVPADYPVLRRAVASQVLAGTLCVLFLAKLCMANYKVDAVMVEIEHAAGILDQFALTHPGVYAMGDRAGMFAISTANPVLQTEGLMMDRAYLRHIERGDDLRSTLRQYGVAYYVAFISQRNRDIAIHDGCFYAAEPAIAGPTALRMRSTFCGAPLYAFRGDDGEYVIYSLEQP